MRIRTLLAMLLSAASLASCQGLLMPIDPSKKQGSLEIHFITTKASLPDTNEFILTVTDSKGKDLYNGPFKEAPSSLIAAAGTYTVSAKSCIFTTPQFEMPQWGDTQIVNIKAGATTVVNLLCTQLNAGIKLSISPTFLQDYPNGILYLQNADGRLMYAYTEKRTAYFRPGNVSLLLSNNGTQSTLFTKRLEEQQILKLNITTSADGNPASDSGIRVGVDTTRQYLSENFCIGQDPGTGGDTMNAMSVTKARESAGMQDVWVYGYIVGGDCSSSRCSFEPPFTARTNLVIAAKSNCEDKEQCLSVQLAQGAVRDAINLVDHEDYLGKKIYLKGDIVESYYGIPGLQCVTEYSF